MRERRGKGFLRIVRPGAGAAAAASLLALCALAGCGAHVRHCGLDAPAQTVDEAGVETTAEEPDSAKIARERAIDAGERFALAQDHFVYARDYERHGANDMAERLYQIAYDFWPRTGFLRTMLFDRYARGNAYDKALGLFFRDGETLGDMPPEDKRSLGLAYLRMGDTASSAATLEALGNDLTDDEIFTISRLYRSAGNEDAAQESFRRIFGGGRPANAGIRIVQMSVGERRIPEAVSLAAILYEAYPQNAEVIALYGVVKHLARDTLSAARLFSEALALDSTNEEALRSLAHISIIGERYAEAAGFYRRLIARGAAGRPYRRGFAFLLFHLKEYDEAGALLDSLISEGDAEESSGLQELHSYRGLVYIQTKNYAGAAGQFKAAISLDSLNEDHRRELCFAYILAKDTVNARAGVNGYLAKFPQSATARRMSGYVYDLQKKHAEAAAEFRKAAEIDPADYFSWFHLGAALERQKLIDEAANAFRAALAIRPGDGDASNYLGYMWADANMNLDSAKVLIEAALKADPLNGAYLDSYAWVFYRLGDYEKALYYMNKALERDDVKSDPVPYEHLGDIQFKLEDFLAAEAAYRKALELKTEDGARVRARLDEIRRILRTRR